MQHTRATRALYALQRYATTCTVHDAFSLSMSLNANRPKNTLTHSLIFFAVVCTRNHLQLLFCRTLVVCWGLLFFCFILMLFLTFLLSRRTSATARSPPNISATGSMHYATGDARSCSSCKRMRSFTIIGGEVCGAPNRTTHLSLLSLAEILRCVCPICWTTKFSTDFEVYQAVAATAAALCDCVYLAFFVPHARLCIYKGIGCIICI